MGHVPRWLRIMRLASWIEVEGVMQVPLARFKIGVDTTDNKPAAMLQETSSSSHPILHLRVMHRPNPKSSRP